VYHFYFCTPCVCHAFVFQVVELDFLYPSEGIHKRWDHGYRITSTAATSDQTALVLSVPRRWPSDEAQETLRTSAFPSRHVKVRLPHLLRLLTGYMCMLEFDLTNCALVPLQEKWSKNLYLASVCYGRTVS
jgi:hypothetical protein